MPKKLYTLEILRFIAAAAVFLGHYVHFSMYLGIPEDHGVFSWVGLPYGGLAVPIFFMMSGAIFSHNYLDAISKRTVSFATYMRRRFARLYPLHFATLMLVAALQATLFFLEGRQFIYLDNDLRHLTLHLLFMSHWGLETGHSFNAPVWSVSHEVALYILFFILALQARRLRHPLPMVGLSLLLTLAAELWVEHPIARSAFQFFTGAFVYQLLALASARSTTLRRALAFGAVLALLLAMKPVWELGGIPFQTTGACAVVISLCLTADWLANWPEDGLFQRASQWLGNISYSTYLLHFPIQLVLLIFTTLVHPLVFESTATLAAYVVLVMAFGVLSFRFFEKPAKEWVLASKSATR